MATCGVASLTLIMNGSYTRAQSPSRLKGPHERDPLKLAAGSFWVLRSRPTSQRITKKRENHQAAAAAVSDTGHPLGTPRRVGHARTTASTTVADRHFRRF